MHPLKSRQGTIKAVSMSIGAAVLMTLPALGLFGGAAAAKVLRPVNAGKKITVTLLTPNYYPSTKTHPRVGAPVGQDAISGIIASYEKLHPNVRIVDITPPPWSALTAWVTSHAADDALPDILENGAGYFTVPELSSELVNLTPYLNQQNPYNKSAKTWGATFDAGLLAHTNENFEGPEYEIATDWYIIHALWYNKTVLNKLHLSAPSTVAQLISDLKVIKAKDKAVIPIEGQGGYFTLPLDGTDAPWFYNLMYPTLKSMDPTQADAFTEQELAWSFKDGSYSYQKNPRLKYASEGLSQLFAPYTASKQALESASTLASSQLQSPNSPFEEFVQGKIAFLPAAGYNTQYFYGADAIHTPFALGVERIPILTKATTKLANPSIQTSGASVGVPYSITMEAQKQGVVSTAVNFLEYMTDVQNDQNLVNNGFRFIPGVIGAAPNKKALAYKLASQGPVVWGNYASSAPNPLSDPSIVSENKSYWEYWGEGELPYATVAARVDQNNLNWANQVIAENHYADPYK